MSESDSHALINQMMNLGYDAAGKSLSKLTNSPVVVKSSVFNHLSHKGFSAGSRGVSYMVTTNLIGELAGKSYLIIGETDFQMVCQFLKLKPIDDLVCAFLLELDNILSAAVISAVSDCLKIEVYGDVPNLSMINSDEYSNTLAAVMDNDEGRYVVYSGSLTLASTCPVSFHFIWKMSRKIYDLKISHQLSA